MNDSQSINEELSLLEKLDLDVLGRIVDRFSKPDNPVNNYISLGRLAQASKTMNTLVEKLPSGKINKEANRLFPSSFTISYATHGFFSTPKFQQETREKTKNANINAKEKREKIHNIPDLLRKLSSKEAFNEMEPSNEYAELLMEHKNLAELQAMDNDGLPIAAYTLARIYGRDALTISDKLREKFFDIPINHELARNYLNKLKSNPIYIPSAKGLITFLDEYRNYKIKTSISRLI